MAITKFSTPFQVTTPQDSVDVNMLANTVATQQARYDQGYTAITNALDYYKTAGLVAEKDQDYVNKRVQALTDQLDGYGNSNLADVKVVANLTSDAKSLSTDPEIMSMVNSQANYKQFMKRLDLLKNDPKKREIGYSSTNEILNMQEIEDWRTGRTKNLTLSSPTLKYDTDKYAQDIAAQLKPQLYTREDGSYLMNGKIKSLDDINTVVMNGINTNPDAQQQLMRNAKVLFMRNTPEEIHYIAATANDNKIKSIQEDIKYKKQQLLRADITPTQKADLQAGVAQMDRQLNQVMQEGRELMSSPLTPQKLEELKYKVYTENYARGVAQRYVVNDQVLTANPVTMQRDRFVHDDVKQKNEFEFQRERDANRLAFEQQKQQQDMAIEYAKLYGSNPEAMKLVMEGRFNEALALGNSGVNAYTNIATVQETDKNPYGTIQTDIQKLNTDNAELARGMLKDIIQTQDTELAHKLKPILQGGGKIDVNSIKNTTTLSPAMLKTLSEYEKLQNDLINPEKLTNEIISNPLLSKYGGYQNQITENLVRAKALQNVITPELDTIYKKYLADGSVKNRKDFDAMVNGGNGADVINYNPERGMRDDVVRPALKSNLGVRIREDVANAVRVSPNYKQYNEFNSIKNVGIEDKVWNGGTDYAAAARSYIKTGVVVDGKVKGVNGQLVEGSVQRSDGSVDDIDINKSLVKGFVDSKNRIYFDLVSTDKDVPPVEAYVELNEDNYRRLRGTSSSAVANNSFTRDLYAGGGQMKDGLGNPIYMNLNGKVKMGGNIKYKFDAFTDDELTLSVLMPTSSGNVTKVLERFKGESAKQKAEQRLTDIYNKTRNYTASVLRAANPRVTEEAIEKQALIEYYKNIDSWKTTP